MWTRISRTNHGENKTRFYNIYNGIVGRCCRPSQQSYKYYGAFGIECEWKTYEDFKKDMYESYLEHCRIYGEKDTTIDRKNVMGNYCKKNCKWTTLKEQNRNKSNVRRFDYKGKRLTAMEIYEIESPNIEYDKFRQRLKRGWDVRRALGLQNWREK